MAQILSRPPGLPACDPDSACGVPGVIAGAQTYDHADALVKAVADGGVATGILPAIDVFRARCVAAPGAATVRVIRVLYRQPIQIVIKADAGIAKPGDLAGKKLAIGEPGTNAAVVAQALFDAYGVPRAKLSLQPMGSAAALAALEKGEVAAAILVGHSFDVPLGHLMSAGGFTLLSLPDSAERQKLQRELQVFSDDAIPLGAYPGVPATSTLSQPVLWVAKPGFDSVFAEKLVADISEPRNLAHLAELVEPVAGVPEGEAFSRLPALLTEGLQRFADMRHLPVDVLECPPPKAAEPSPVVRKRPKPRSHSQ